MEFPKILFVYPNVPVSSRIHVKLPHDNRAIVCLRRRVTSHRQVLLKWFVYHYFDDVMPEHAFCLYVKANMP